MCQVRLGSCKGPLGRGSVGTAVREVRLTWSVACFYHTLIFRCHCKFRWTGEPRNRREQETAEKRRSQRSQWGRWNDSPLRAQRLCGSLSSLSLPTNQVIPLGTTE